MIRKRKIYIEIGYGNESFINTEVELENGKEYRIKGIVPFKKFKDIYSRLWINKTVYVLSTRNGFEKVQKNRKKFKFIFGIYGER